MTRTRFSFLLPPLLFAVLSRAWTRHTSSSCWTTQLVRPRPTTSSARRTPRGPSSSLQLFIRNEQSTSGQVSGPVLQDLSRPEVQFPFTILDTRANDKVIGQQRSTLSTGKADELTIRFMEWNDIEAITDICVDEYGDKPDVHISNVLSPDFWMNWAEYLALRPLVDLSMRLKVRSYADPNVVPSDHAVLVACLRSSDTNAAYPSDRIVGMVELSRQPLRPDRNPPPLPIPYAVKKLLFGADPLQGWITNLLVVPGDRGRGFAKTMLAACDGLARRWGCQSISLHCDADPDSGRAAQRLYAKCGYRPLDNKNNDFSASEQSWITARGMSGNGGIPYYSSIFVIDDVPLLYLQKKLG